MNRARPLKVVLIIMGIMSPLVMSSAQVSAADWPQWRHDAGRSGVTNEELPAELHLQWRRQLPTPAPAWPGRTDLDFDTVHQPIVLGKVLFLPSSRNDSVTAYDTATGEEVWRFFADGPIRFAPVGIDGKIYFGSDDGFLYCLDAKDGRLLSKFNAAPSKRIALGNDRLISVWPIRCGPVASGKSLYFTAGVWPFEGVFLHSLDISASPQGIAPHATVSIGGQPQGYLAAAGGNVFVPANRSEPLVIDQDIRNFRPANAELGGNIREKRRSSFVAAVGEWYFHNSAVHLRTSKGTSRLAQAYRPVFTNQAAYTSTIRELDRNKNEAVIYALKLKAPDGKGAKPQLSVLWQLNNPQIVDLTAIQNKGQQVLRSRWVQQNPVRVQIKAAGRLYGWQARTVFALDLPAKDKKPRISWTAELDGDPGSMLAADGKLFVTTKEGGLYCFAGEKVQTKRHLPRTTPLETKTKDSWTKKTQEILSNLPQKEGYCLVLGIGSGRLLTEILVQSRLRVIVLEPDAEKAKAWRNRLDAAGLYGFRIAIHQTRLTDFELPPFFASLITGEELAAHGSPQSKVFLSRVYQALRPYGGTAWLIGDPDQQKDWLGQIRLSKLPGAEEESGEAGIVLRRRGALAGAGSWTHEYGDAANTLMSGDSRVRGPFGVLWYGGPAGAPGLLWDRHRPAASPVISGGRMVLQGPGKLTAVDVFTGRIHWQVDMKPHYGNRPYHIRLAAADDAFYAGLLHKCLKLNAATGRVEAEFKPAEKTDVWGSFRIRDDLLIVPVMRKIDPKSNWSKYLVRELWAMDRHTGKVRWKQSAKHSFSLLTVSKDRVFYFDCKLPVQAGGHRIGGHADAGFAASRRGLKPGGMLLSALELSSGRRIWTVSVPRIVQWLSCSADNILVASDFEGLHALNGNDGKTLWQQTTGSGAFARGGSTVYTTIVWNDKVLRQGNRKAYDLKTGKARSIAHPLTRTSVDWRFALTGFRGCAYAVAGENLLTYRGGHAAYCHLEECTASVLEGFRLGCRNSLLPADGILCAPNLAEGCVCNYGLFTSLALVHRPAAQQWSCSSYGISAGERIRRVGVNFGAPGDRYDASKTLWLKHPIVNWRLLHLRITTTPDKVRPFRHHPSQFSGKGYAWVAASGIEGASKITIPLGPNTQKLAPYTVRLHFAEPEKRAIGERVFDVKLQGKTVLTGFDIVKESGGSRRTVVRQFSGVQIGPSLAIAFTAKNGSPLICGVELLLESGE